MSDATQPVSASAEPLAGLTNPRALELDRFLIRYRGGAATQSAWRLSVACDEGQGAIIFLEISPEETFYRGEGLFLGWPQERMAAAYRSLVPRAEEESFEFPQGG